jgi:ketosteroid isomerase-like protein
MRFSAATVLLTLICTVPSYAQTGRIVPNSSQQGTGSRPPTPTSSHIQARLLQPIQLEDQWTSALVRRDTRAFDRLLAPGFVYTEDASVMDRNDVIKSVSGPDRVEWARNEGMKLHNFGDVHVITGVLHLKGRGTHGPFDRRYQFTDTWQYKNGRWQMIAAQDYLIPR